MARYENDQRIGTLNERRQKPEKIGDEELGNLIAAIGNSEVKAITLLGMSEDQIYTANGLKKMLDSLQERQVGGGD